MRSTLLAASLLSGLPLIAQASSPARYVEIDYRKVERRLVKEPTYIAPAVVR